MSGPSQAINIGDSLGESEEQHEKAQYHQKRNYLNIVYQDRELGLGGAYA